MKKIKILDKYPRILITGCTGSFGKAFLNQIIKLHPNLKRIVIFSRDELKQWELQNKYPKESYPQLRFFIGDIRDLQRLQRALKNIDLVIHAAALKQVPIAEYNPTEFIKTNIIGSENIIQASLDNNVKRVIALSTDKAVAPINLYGATKLCSDKLFISANSIKGDRDIIFSVVRYGNVMGSRGSVIPYFLKQSKNGYLDITDERMTRFNIPLIDGVNMVIWALENMLGGEIFIPKIPSYKITDLVEAIGPNCKKNIIGVRNGEKIHEEMITEADSFNTLDIGKYFVILPSDGILQKRYLEIYKNSSKVPQNFSYSSNSNCEYLNVSEIRKLIKDHVDSDFEPR